MKLQVAEFGQGAVAVAVAAGGPAPQLDVDALQHQRLQVGELGDRQLQCQPPAFNRLQSQACKLPCILAYPTRKGLGVHGVLRVVEVHCRQRRCL